MYIKTHTHPGAVSGTCVAVRQNILGVEMTTATNHPQGCATEPLLSPNLLNRYWTIGMCYADALGAAFSARDWMGLALNCSDKSAPSLYTPRVTYIPMHMNIYIYIYIHVYVYI